MQLAEAKKRIVVLEAALEVVKNERLAYWYELGVMKEAKQKRVRMIAELRAELVACRQKEDPRKKSCE